MTDMRCDAVATLLDYCTLNEVSLANAEITTQSRWSDGEKIAHPITEVKFDFEMLTREELHNLKKAVGGFEVSGGPPYITLKKRVEWGRHTFEFRLNSAYECEYKCKAKHPTLVSEMTNESDPS